MRFLKNKIAFAKAIKPENKLKNKRKRIPGYSSTPAESRATKNIIKNYGRAICSFSASKIALPYLNRIITTDQDIQVDGFTAYINSIKSKIDGLHHFRHILMPNMNDNAEMAAYKKTFQEISEVFIKYFSVNWIFHSKIQHKEAHLKFRFKMLRRIKSPELFTYLKSSTRLKKDIVGSFSKLNSP